MPLPNRKNVRLLVEERRRRILELLAKEERATVEELADRFNVSTVTIRGEPHTIVEAINRQLAHYAYHVGQIVFLAKHFRSAEWKSLSIPRKK